MFLNWWKKSFNSASKPVSHSRRSLRLNPRWRIWAEALEDRTVPATLNLADVAPSALTFAGEIAVVNDLTISVTGTDLEFTDPNDPITLGQNAIDAGCTVAGDTATCPLAAVTAITVTGGDDDGDTVTFASALAVDGDLSVSEFTTINVNDAVSTTPAGAITLSASSGLGPVGLLTVAATGSLDAAGNVTLAADNMTLDGPVTSAGAALLRQFTFGQLIDLGDADANDTLGLTSAEIDAVTATSLQIGNNNSGSITITDSINPANVSTLSLQTGAAIVDGNLTGNDLIVTNLALRAVNGIGDGDPLETQVTNLAFSNTTAGAVEITNQGALTINSVNGLATSSNGGAATSLIANSPITFAVNTTSAGTLTATATESAATNTDNITVNAPVTVSSTAGNVDFQAGDRIILNGTVQAINGSIGFASGFGDTDGDGAMTLNGTLRANVMMGGVITLDVGMTGGATQAAAGQIIANQLLLLGMGTTGIFTLDASTTNNVANMAAFTMGLIRYRDSNALNVGTVGGIAGITTTMSEVTLCSGGNLALDQSISVGTGTVRLTATGVVSQADAPVAIFAAALGVRAGTGITLLSEANDVDTLAAVSTMGNIAFVDFDGFTIGTVTASGCFTPDTSGVGSGGGAGGITLCSSGDLTVGAPVNGGGGTVRLIALAGRVTQTAMIMAANLGVRATDEILLDVVANGVTGNFAAFSSGAGSAIRFRNNGSFSVASIPLSTCFALTDGVISTDGPIALTTVNGALTVTNTPAAFDIDAGTSTIILTAGSSGNDNALTISTGAVVRATGGTVAFPGVAAVALIADNMVLDGSIQAGAALVTLRQFENGTAINLGGADGAATLGLIDAELDRITANTLRIGNASSGSITISASISPANVLVLSLHTGNAIVDGNATGNDLIVAELALRAVNGIGDGNALDTQRTAGGPLILAFENTGAMNAVRILNQGALRLFGLDGMTSCLNNGPVTDIRTRSPVTFAADLTVAGTLIVTATESAAVNTDNITVHAGVTITSYTGDVSFYAGDRILLYGTVQAPNGSIRFASGFTDRDGDGSMTLTGILSANTTTGTVTLEVGGTGGLEQTGGQITAHQVVRLGPGTVPVSAERVVTAAAAPSNLSAKATSLAARFLNATETQTNLVRNFYQRYLGRVPEAAGLQHWQNVLALGGRAEDVLLGILGSAEYHARQGGTVAAFVGALYRDLLGRTAAASDVNNWVRVLSAESRGNVVHAFVSSDEFRGGLIQTWYQRHLGRSADSEGLSAWLERMRRGATQEQVQAAILTSAEFRQSVARHLSTQDGDANPAYIRALYQNVLGRTTAPGEVDGWLLALGLS